MNITEFIFGKLEALSQIGRTIEGGNTRLAFTEEDLQARKLFCDWMYDLGLDIRVDGIGNIFGRFEGKNNNLPPIIVGSHLDTVPNGGIYDGTYGCVSALCCASIFIEESRRLNHPFEVAVFADEEGSRFGTTLMGSSALSGKLNLKELEKAVSKDGVSALSVLEAQGFLPKNISEVKVNKGEIGAYLELHIEQGAVLEKREKKIGIVTGIVGVRRWKFHIVGEANHAGTTPFALRKDALLGAAQMIIAVPNLCSSLGKTETVATVGQLSLHPGAVNIVPGEVTFSLEIRDLDDDLIDSIENAIIEDAERIAKQNNLGIETELISSMKSVKMDRRIIDTIGEVIKKNGISAIEMPSGAAHDAQSLALIAPTGMIFVPSRNGISHSPDEFTEKEDLALGASLLLETIGLLDGRI